MCQENKLPTPVSSWKNKYSGKTGWTSRWPQLFLKIIRSRNKGTKNIDIIFKEIAVQTPNYINSQ